MARSRSRWVDGPYVSGRSVWVIDSAAFAVDVPKDGAIAHSR
jgi:hypothetical protein